MASSAERAKEAWGVITGLSREADGDGPNGAPPEGIGSRDPRPESGNAFPVVAGRVR
jgi:hypothetical protein